MQRFRQKGKNGYNESNISLVVLQNILAHQQAKILNYVSLRKITITFTLKSDENTRQVTKVGSSYYITKDAADGVAKSTTGCPGDTGWGTYFETMTSFAS